MNHQQILASKPHLLNPKRTDSLPAKSSEALRGATTAFQPKTPVPTFSNSPVAAGAKLAALTAGSAAQKRAGSTSPERRDGKAEVSPVRGRTLQTNAALTVHTLPSQASSSKPIYAQEPTPPERSSSVLAARHASVKSRSPRRSPDQRLPRHIMPGVSQAIVKSRTQNEALSGATASFASSAGVSDRSHNEPVQSVQSRRLNYETLPSLSHIRNPSPTKPQLNQKAIDLGDQPCPFSSDLSQSREPNKSTGRPTRAYSATTLQKLPQELLPRPTDITLPKTAPILISGSNHTTSSTGPELNQMQASRLAPPLLPRRSRSQVARKHEDTYRNTMTVNALADAMVASSLASSRNPSRNPSPSKRPPLPVPRRRSHSYTALHDLKHGPEKALPMKRNKSPRPMKHTLRKRSSSGEDEVELIKRGRRHWMRKHPNKHSEGNRKRWRDKVTELERKRYEGVFAANRGLLVEDDNFEFSPSTVSDSTALGNQVVNIIVRDIWERSRLPREVLREIYDLVSPEEALVLNREQFVVGLWLIDQRLKGRKLPVKVSPSVWASVRHSQGIKIRRQQL